MAEKDWMHAREYVQHAIAIVDRFEVLVAGWQVHAAAWHFYRHAKDKEAAERHLASAEACILKIANSFANDEPLRESFLSARPVARILSVSANKRAVAGA